MKRNISDLLDAYGDPNIDLDRGTPLSSERIKVMTMSRIKEEKKPRKRVAFRVMMAAAIIAALAVTAFATASGAIWFQTFFAGQSGEGLSAEQMALIEQNAVAVDQSQTIDGYTIHVNSVMNDERTIYVKLDLYAPEGVVLPYGDNRSFEKMALRTYDGEQVDSGWSLDEPIDEDKTDNHVEMLMTFKIEDGVDTAFLLPGGGVRLELTKLTKTYGSFFSRKTETMADGTWQFDLQFATTQEDLWERELIGVPVPCTMVKYHTDEETGIFITSVCLRALTIDVVYDYPDGADQEPLYWLGMKVIKKDGTAVRVLPSGEQFGPVGDKIVGSISFVPDAPIVLDEVACIEFPGGTRIPVNVEE